MITSPMITWPLGSRATTPHSSSHPSTSCSPATIRAPLAAPAPSTKGRIRTRITKCSAIFPLQSLPCLEKQGFPCPSSPCTTLTPTPHPFLSAPRLRVSGGTHRSLRIFRRAIVGSLGRWMTWQGRASSSSHAPPCGRMHSACQKRERDPKCWQLIVVSKSLVLEALVFFSLARVRQHHIAARSDVPACSNSCAGAW